MKIALVISLLAGVLSAGVADAVKHRVAETGAPGVTIAIVRDDKIAYEGAFSMRRLRGAAMDTETRFEIGSLTKLFTAAAILQLKERGKLALDDRLNKYLPQFPHASEITLRRLLNQTTGLPDFMQTNHFLRISRTSPGGFARIARMAEAPLHFTPGSRWEYSNTNYIALGRVIEVVSGQSYDRYVRRHLFAAAGMTHTTTVENEHRVTDMATGYWRGLEMKGALIPAPALTESWSWSAGDIISTVGDLARWQIALQTGHIISKSDFAVMTTPVRLSNGKAGDYGFHWWSDSVHGHAMLSSLGDTYGSSSCIDIFPGEQLAIIVLENMAVNPDRTSDAAAGFAVAAFDSLVK